MGGEVFYGFQYYTCLSTKGVLGLHKHILFLSITIKTSSYFLFSNNDTTSSICAGLTVSCANIQKPKKSKHKM